MTELAPHEAKAMATQQRVNGVVDVLRSNRIAGWAIDRLDASAAVKVEILRDGVPYRSIIADRYRQDLEKGGIGTGKYGFSVEVDPPIEAGLEFTVTALARTSDGHTAPLKPVGAAEHPARPELLMLHRLAASLDGLKATYVQSNSHREGLLAVADRLEMTQIRLEAALSALEALPPTTKTAHVPKAVYGIAFIGLLALAVGIGSVGFG